MLIFLLLSIPLSLGAQELQFTARVNPQALAEDQILEVIFELSGSGISSLPRPRLPDFPDFIIISGPNQSTSYEFINGSMSLSKTYGYTLMPKRAGSFKIGSAEVRYKGKDYRTDPVLILVSKGGMAARKVRPSDREKKKIQPGLDIFLRAALDKVKAYQNEMIVLTYKIYTGVRISSYGVQELPRTTGFWVEEFELPKQPPLKDEVVNGQHYRAAVIKKLALFPTSPGKLTIDPMVVECEVQAQRRRRAYDPFDLDSFFDDSFLFGRTVKKVLKSNPLTLEVIPLPPENQPPGFGGTVGEFNLSVRVDKEKVKTNEAITLTVTLAGRGNIKTLPEPVLSLSPDFERYEPKISEVINRKGSQISGKKTFEYVLIPRHPGEQVIQPISFSFFNPAKKRYVTQQSGRFIIQVEKGPEAPGPLVAGLTKEEVKLVGQDIRFIKKRVKGFKKQGSFPYQGFVFTFLIIFPLFVLGGTVFYRSRQDRLGQNAALARFERAYPTVQKALKRVARLQSADRAKEFYGDLSGALMGYFGDKLNKSAVGFSVEELEKILTEKGIDDNLVQRTKKILTHCDYARFAPGEVQLEQLESVLKKSQGIIKSLEKTLVFSLLTNNLIILVSSCLCG